jgi:DMSO/TMAO reductase YedYZ molybdopterin-dependent catalytic subunit
MTTGRRRFLSGLVAGGTGLVLSGCDALNANDDFRSFLRTGEALNQSAQRLWLTGDALARPDSRSEMSPVFRANGTTRPGGAEYTAHASAGFADWQLQVDGLVERPLRLSLEALRNMPVRTQITRHDCVEGWSAIGEWSGPRLASVLALARLKPEGRFIFFHCADNFGANPYYESIDLTDAMHPQTILAHTMNGRPLPVAHGAPLRLRVERQLGYKHAKYVMRIEVRSTLAGVGLGKGGFWEDQVDYDWYAGI